MKKRKLVSLILGGVSCCFMNFQSVSALKLANALKAVLSMQGALDTWSNGGTIKLNNAQKDLIYYQMIYRLCEIGGTVKNEDGKDVSTALFTDSAVKSEVSENQGLHPLDAFFKLASKDPEKFSSSDEAISQILLAVWKYGNVPAKPKIDLVKEAFKEDYLPAVLSVFGSYGDDFKTYFNRGNASQLLLNSIDWPLVHGIKNELISSKKTADEIDLDYMYDLFGCVPIIFNERDIFKSFMGTSAQYEPNSGDFFINNSLFSSLTDYESTVRSFTQYSKNQGFTRDREKSQIVLPAFVRPLTDKQKNNSDYVNEYAFFKGSNSLDVCKHNFDLSPEQELARQIIIWGYMQKNKLGVPGSSKVSASDIKAYADDLKKDGPLCYNHFGLGFRVDPSQKALFEAIVQFLRNNRLSVKDDHSLEIEPRIYSPENMQMTSSEFRKIYKRMLGEEARYKFCMDRGFVRGIKRINETGGMETFNRACTLSYASLCLDSDCLGSDGKPYDLNRIIKLSATPLKNFSNDDIKLTDEVINKCLAGKNRNERLWVPDAGLVEHLSRIIFNTQWRADNFEITPFSDYSSEKVSSDSLGTLGDLLEKCENMSPEVFGKIICYLHNPAIEDKIRLTKEIITAMGNDSKLYVQNLLETLSNIRSQKVYAHFADYMVLTRFLEVFGSKIHTEHKTVHEKANFIIDNFVSEPMKAKIESLISSHYHDNKSKKTTVEQNEEKNPTVEQNGEKSPLMAFVAEILKNISPKEKQDNQNNNNDNDNQVYTGDWSEFGGPLPKTPSEKTTLLSEFYLGKDSMNGAILSTNARNDVLGVSENYKHNKCLDDFPKPKTFFDKFCKDNEAANFAKTCLEAEDVAKDGWLNGNGNKQSEWLKNHTNITSPLFENVYKHIVEGSTNTIEDNRKTLNTPRVCLEVNAGETLSKEDFIDTIGDYYEEQVIKNTYRLLGAGLGLRLKQVKPVIDKTGEVMNGILKNIPWEYRNTYKEQLSEVKKEVFKFLSREDIWKFTINGLKSGLRLNDDGSFIGESADRVWIAPNLIRSKRYAFELVDTVDIGEKQDNKKELISITTKMLDEKGDETLDTRRRYITVPNIVTLTLGSKKYQIQFREIKKEPINRPLFETIRKKVEKPERNWFHKTIERRVEISELYQCSAEFAIRRYLNNLNPKLNYKVKFKILNKVYSQYQDVEIKADHIFTIAEKLGFEVVRGYNPKKAPEPGGKVCYCMDGEVIFKVPKTES